MVIDVEVVVDRPLAQTFGVFMDVSRMSEWVSGFQRMEPISGTPHTPGSKYRIFLLENGREVEQIETVTSVDSDKLFAIFSDQKTIQSKTEIHFSREIDHTRISARTDVRTKTILWKFLLPLLKSHISRQQQSGYRKLKRIIETEPFR